MSFQAAAYMTAHWKSLSSPQISAFDSFPKSLRKVHQGFSGIYGVLGVSLAAQPKSSLFLS